MALRLRVQLAGAGLSKRLYLFEPSSVFEFQEFKNQIFKAAVGNIALNHALVGDSVLFFGETEADVVIEDGKDILMLRDGDLLTLQVTDRVLTAITSHAKIKVEPIVKVEPGLSDSAPLMCIDLTSEDEDDDVVFEKDVVESSEDELDIEEIHSEYDSEYDDKSQSKNAKKTAVAKIEKKKTAKKYSAKKSTLYVHLDDKDMPHAPGDVDADEGKWEVDQAHEEPDDGLGAVKARIAKMLNRGLHENANENEAKTCLKMATRLLQQHNLKQADILLSEGAGGGLSSAGSMKAGMVKCELRRGVPGASTWKIVKSRDRWISHLAQVCDANFRAEGPYPEAFNLYLCGSDEVVFYGIESQAQLAAYAFKVGVSRIVAMQSTYSVDKEDYQRKYFTGSTSLSQAAYTRLAKLNYCMGLCNGLESAVREDKERREKRKDRKMQRARKRLEREVKDPNRYLSRIEAPKDVEEVKDVMKEKKSDHDASVVEDGSEGRGKRFNDFGSGDDGNMGDHYDGGYESEVSSVLSEFSDVGAEDLKKFRGRGRDNEADWSGIATAPIKAEEDGRHEGKCGAKGRMEELEKKGRASSALVVHSSKIAEDVLKGNGIKLKKGKKRKVLSEFNVGAYKQGKKDSKLINLNQRTISDK